MLVFKQDISLVQDCIRQSQENGGGKECTKI